MKFRIENNIIKFRLTLNEIEKLKANQTLTNNISFSPGNKFEYAIKPSNIAPELSLKFENGSAIAEVPVGLLNDWFISGQVGLKEVLIGDRGEQIKVVIEEDLPPRKLKKRPRSSAT